MNKKMKGGEEKRRVEILVLSKNLLAGFTSKKLLIRREV